MRKRVFATIIIAFLAILAFQSDPVQAGYQACGYDFRADRTGVGGVEICGIGYPCGVADGVCPMNFSQGGNSSKYNYTHPYIKYPTPNVSSVNDDLTRPWETGDAACAPIGGTCTDVLNASNKSGAYTSLGSSWCDDNTATFANNSYYKAKCEGVPEVAGCENCPDPDCSATVEGYVSDSAGEGLDDATVTLINNNNNNLRIQTETNSSGEFSIPDGAIGYYNVTCGRKLFEERQFQTYIQKGQDTVSCRSMQASGCSPGCTAPNEYGEPICVSECNGQNGCSMNESLQETCGGLPEGSERVLNRKNDTHVRVTQCCTGPTSLRYQPKGSFSVNENTADGQISNLEIREYRRELNGTPVTVRVAVYDEEE